MDWSHYKRYIYAKYRRSSAVSVFAYSRKYNYLLDNVRDIDILPSTIKANVIKSLVALAKYQGVHEEFRSRLKSYGIKASRPNAFASFLRILNNDNGNLLEWYREASNILRVNEQIYLRFVATTGLRANEAINSFKLIIQQYKSNKLETYYNEDLKALEHFKFKQFLRRTKNTYLSFVPENTISNIANSRTLTYYQVNKRLEHKGFKTRINELRDYFATFMVRHGLIREEVDLLQGRIPPNIFIRHYWSPSFKNLRNRTLKAIGLLEQSL